MSIDWAWAKRLQTNPRTHIALKNDGCMGEERWRGVVHNTDNVSNSENTMMTNYKRNYRQRKRLQDKTEGLTHMALDERRRHRPKKKQACRTRRTEKSYTKRNPFIVGNEMLLWHSIALVNACSYRIHSMRTYVALSVLSPPAGVLRCVLCIFASYLCMTFWVRVPVFLCSLWPHLGFLLPKSVFNPISQSSRYCNRLFCWPSNIAVIPDISHLGE